MQVGAGDATEEERRAALMDCLAEFTALWKQREKGRRQSGSTS